MIAWRRASKDRPKERNDRGTDAKWLRKVMADHIATSKRKLILCTERATVYEYLHCGGRERQSRAPAVDVAKERVKRQV
jgi:hypothetical protein